MRIAVTGCYGSGKSSVSRLLSSYLGACLCNTDFICRELMEPGEEGFVGLQKEFGERFITRDGQLDRLLLREVVLTDTVVKTQLEAIVHPLVRKSVGELAEQSAGLNLFLVVEVPLLFEVGWQEDFDVTVLVRVANETCVNRVIARDEIDREEAQRIINQQLPMSCKEPLADYIIDNGSTFVSTAQQTAWLATLLANTK